MLNIDTYTVSLCEDSDNVCFVDKYNGLLRDCNRILSVNSFEVSIHPRRYVAHPARADKHNYHKLCKHKHMADVLVLGSSHIEKLRLFIQADPSLYNFDCHDRKIECFGISGGKIENSTHVKLLEDKINTLRPKRVVVQIGGNDLDTAGIDEEGVRLLTLRLINIFSLFRNKYKLDVYLCQFMFREKTRNVHPVQYNELGYTL